MMKLIIGIVLGISVGALSAEYVDVISTCGWPVRNGVLECVLGGGHTAQNYPTPTLTQGTSGTPNPDSRRTGIGAMAQSSNQPNSSATVGQPRPATDWLTTPQVFMRAGGYDETGKSHPLRMDAKGRVIARCDLEP